MREVGYIYERLILKVILHRRIRNHAQHNFAMLEQCCVLSKQCRNNVATLEQCCPAVLH